MGMRAQNMAWVLPAEGGWREGVSASSCGSSCCRTLPSCPGGRWEGDTARIMSLISGTCWGGLWLHSGNVTIPAEERTVAPEQLLCQGCGQGSAGAGQEPKSMRAHLCEVLLEAIGQSLANLESCRAAEEHGLRTVLLYHESPSPATACGHVILCRRTTGFLQLLTSPLHLLEVSEGSRVPQSNSRDLKGL